MWLEELIHVVFCMSFIKSENTAACYLIFESVMPKFLRKVRKEMSYLLHLFKCISEHADLKIYCFMTEVEGNCWKLIRLEQKRGIQLILSKTKINLKSWTFQHLIAIYYVHLWKPLTFIDERMAY